MPTLLREQLHCVREPPGEQIFEKGGLFWAFMSRLNKIRLLFV
jgi:hypothetical protein